MIVIVDYYFIFKKDFDWGQVYMQFSAFLPAPSLFVLFKKTIMFYKILKNQRHQYDHLHMYKIEGPYMIKKQRIIYTNV